MTLRTILLFLISFALAGAAVPAKGQIRLTGVLEGDLPVIAGKLDLTEPQREILHAFWSEYSDAIREKLTPVSREAGGLMREAALAANRPQEYDYQVESRFREAFDKTNDALAILNELDAAFMDNVESLLSNNQLKRMPFVRWWRQRMIYKRDRRELPGGNVDLFEILDGMESRVDNDVAARIDALRIEWEPIYIDMIARASRQYQQAELYSSRFGEAFVRLREKDYANHHPVHWVQVRDTSAERGARRRVSVRDELLAFSEARLRDFTEALPPDLAYEMRTVYLKQAYPEVYPDPATAERLYAAALDLDDLTADQREALLAYRTRFRRDHDRLSREMCANILEFRRESIGGAPYAKPYSENWWESRTEIGNRRMKLSERQIDLIRPLLTPEQLARLPEWDFETDPPVRPWHQDDLHDPIPPGRAIHTPRPDHPEFESADDR